MAKIAVVSYTARNFQLLLLTIIIFTVVTWFSLETKVVGPKPKSPLISTFQFDLTLSAKSILTFIVIVIALRIAITQTVDSTATPQYLYLIMKIEKIFPPTFLLCSIAVS